MNADTLSLREDNVFRAFSAYTGGHLFFNSANITCHAKDTAREEEILWWHMQILVLILFKKDYFSSFSLSKYKPNKSLRTCTFGRLHTPSSLCVILL